MNLTAARNEYSTIRLRSHAEDRGGFNALCRAALGADADNATPEQWVAVAKTVKVPCRRCCATGRFITMTENGIPKGPGGDCYRCAGKGWQNDADARRNAIADRFYQPRL